MRFRSASAAFTALVLAIVPSAARAQPARELPGQPCSVVPDTAVVPTPKQVQERRELRARLDSIGRANGIAAPAGLLLVDVNAERQGKVIFIDANYPQPVVDAATRSVAEYLSTLPAGKAYQALVRIDGDYPALAPGRRHCPPVLANRDTLSDLMQRVLQRHPDAGRLSAPVARRAVVRLVVSHEGRVSYAEVEQPTGDAAIDPYVETIARSLRFLPARLDGTAYDTRFRFTMTFTVK
jgi:TonB family protein